MVCRSGQGQGQAALFDLLLGDEAAPLATTTLGAPAIELPPGKYRLEIRTDPPRTVERVVLAAGERLIYQLTAPPDD